MTTRLSTLGTFALILLTACSTPSQQSSADDTSSSIAGSVSHSASAEVQGYDDVTLEVPEDLRTSVFATERHLTVPKGFGISVVATGLGKPRFLDADDAGTLFVTDIGGGRVVAIQEGVTRVIDSNLRNPHGIDWYKGDLFVAEETRIVVYRSIQPDGTFAKKDVLVTNLPSGGQHVTRTLVVSPQEELIVAMGSSCNVCEEDDERRAAVSKYTLEGAPLGLVAKGLRNSVGVAYHNGKLWSVDNGRDRIGDNSPPDEVNIVEQDADYGWPYCHGSGGLSPEYPAKATFCATGDRNPAYELQAHSAPLGIAFQPGTDTLAIAYHGSWNRTEPTGYKVVTLDTGNPSAIPQDLVSGWTLPDGTNWGRPVGLLYAQNGSLYITDDKAGAIYRLAPREAGE